jgi:hypothetical protein
MKLKEIVYLSSEKLSLKEFKEYIVDYFNNYKEYNIDRRSRYFKEIKYCMNNIEGNYKLYCELYCKWG